MLVLDQHCGGFCSDWDYVALLCLRVCVVSCVMDLKRPHDSHDDTKSKKLKEGHDIPSLLQEIADDSEESKEAQIQKLKAALQDTCESLSAWKEACSDYDPITIKTELASIKTLKAQYQEARKRDRSLVMRLSTKEQEIHDLQIQVNDLRQALNPHSRQLVGTHFDPAVNLYIQKLKDEIKQLERRLKQAQDDLEAQTFTPHSVTGRKLMTKCRSLQDENEELGKQLAEGKVHKLLQETALQREYAEELKASLAEANEFVLQLDHEVELLHQTIFTMQRQLKGYKDREARLKAGDVHLAASGPIVASPPTTSTADLENSFNSADVSSSSIPDPSAGVDENVDVMDTERPATEQIHLRMNELE